jgi:hypothetical protein
MRLLVKGTAFHSAYSSNWLVWKQFQSKKKMKGMDFLNGQHLQVSGLCRRNADIYTVVVD